MAVGSIRFSSILAAPGYVVPIPSGGVLMAGGAPVLVTGSLLPLTGTLLVEGQYFTVRLAGPETGTLTVAGAAPTVTVGVVTEATDDFNRGSLGGNWTIIYDGVTLTANEMTFTDTEAAAYYHAFLPGADYEVECDLTTDGDGGPIGNATDAGGGSFYLAEANTGNTKIWRCDSGSFTQLAVGSGVSVGQTITLQRIGTTLKIFADAVEVLSVTDGSPLSGGYGGIYNFNTVGAYDNFRVATL